jgi:hypothetical protein
MTAIATGSLVNHVSLGIGKVVAVEATAVHVFFPESEKRFAAKLRWPAASALLTTDGVEPNGWLQGLTSFAFDASSGRYALATNFLSHDDAISEFLQVYPGGFVDPAYVGDGSGRRERAWHWRAAHEEWARALGGGEGERLVAEGDLAELARRTLRVAAHVSRLAGVVELDALAEALQPGDVVKGYFEALFALLTASATTRGRVEKVFATSEALGGDPDAAWAMATLFPFIAAPKRFVLVLPKLASGAATRLGCDLKLKPAPNWATYAALHGLSMQLVEKLRASGARDFIDVECFLHTLVARRTGSASSRAVASAAPSSTPKAAKAAKAMRGREVRDSSPAPQRKR